MGNGAVQSRQSRILYLDSLRAFVMSLGVVLHAGMFDRFWFSGGVSYASGLFRMKLFVFIAGFFAIMLHDKRGFAELRRERLIRFGVPCLLFILLINPVANLYAYRFLVGPLSLPDYLSPGFGWPVGTPERINWHQHLWFLIVVLVYSLAMPLFLRVADSRAIARALNWLDSERVGWQARILVLAIAMTLLFIGGRTLHFLLFQRLLIGGPLNFVVQAILWYWPYFLLGILAFRDRRLFDLLHRAPLWQGALSVGVLALSGVLYHPFRVHFGKAAAETVQHLGESFAGFYLCVLLLMLFSRYANVENRTIRFLSDASYTVYLFHFSLIAVLGYYITRLGLGPLFTYLTTIAVVYGACLLLHRYLVDTGPLPRLVFNGRLPRRPLAPTGGGE